MVGGRRTDYFLQRDELRERCHLVVIHSYVHVIERRRIEAVLRRSAQQDLIDLTELVEVTHIRTAAVRAQQVQHRSGGCAGTLTLDRIHMHFVFRETLRIGGHRALYLLALLQFSQENIGLITKITHVAVALILHLQVNAVRRTITRDLRHLERQHLRILDTLAVQIELIDHQVDIVLEARTVVPVFQTNDEGRITRSGRGDQTITATEAVTLQLRDRFHFLFHLLHDLCVLMERRTFRHTHLAHDHTLVLLRHQTRRQDLHEEYHQYNRAA